jgi:acyl-CoA reductase-like NAD-dependent aldehyde dehydrogenase
MSGDGGVGVPTTSDLAAQAVAASASAAMIIDGRRVQAKRTFEVLNPATGSRLADAPDCTGMQLDDAMEAASCAFRTWRLDDAARCAAMQAAAHELQSAAMELALILTAEQGKPLRDSLAEVETVAKWLHWYAELDCGPEIIEDNVERKVVVYRRPLGPCVAITPWNFPIQIAGKKAAQALRPRNTVVVKPSPYTPLATLKLVEVVQRAFPPRVLSAVSGGSPLGPWMVEYPLTRKISFTGSTRAGKQVAAAAAPDLKRITLELGGNDAAIVLDDADPAVVARGIFDRAFVNCGQTCAAIKRVYAPQSLFDSLAEASSECASAAVIGDGMDPATDYGPLNNRQQLETVSELVRNAIANGARVLTGGEASGDGGYFYRPTILTQVHERMPIVDEEQFGPALPILSYTRLDDAVERANSGPFGLGGSVWTGDPDRGAEVASRLECGTAWVNTHAVNLVSQPFAGAKSSGIGVENGRWGMHEFTQIQAIHTAL